MWSRLLKRKESPAEGEGTKVFPSQSEIDALLHASRTILNETGILDPDREAGLSLYVGSEALRSLIQAIKDARDNVTRKTDVLSTARTYLHSDTTIEAAESAFTLAEREAYELSESLRRYGIIPATLTDHEAPAEDTDALLASLKAARARFPDLTAEKAESLRILEAADFQQQINEAKSRLTARSQAIAEKAKEAADAAAEVEAIKARIAEGERSAIEDEKAIESTAGSMRRFKADAKKASQLTDEAQNNVSAIVKPVPLAEAVFCSREADHHVLFLCTRAAESARAMIDIFPETHRISIAEAERTFHFETLTLEDTSGLRDVIARIHAQPESSKQLVMFYPQDESELIAFKDALQSVMPPEEGTPLSGGFIVILRKDLRKQIQDDSPVYKALRKQPYLMWPWHPITDVKGACLISARELDAWQMIKLRNERRKAARRYQTEQEKLEKAPTDAGEKLAKKAAQLEAMRGTLSGATSSASATTEDVVSFAESVAGGVMQEISELTRQYAACTKGTGWPFPLPDEMVESARQQLSDFEEQLAEAITSLELSTHRLQQLYTSKVLAVKAARNAVREARQSAITAAEAQLTAAQTEHNECLDLLRQTYAMTLLVHRGADIPELAERSFAFFEAGATDTEAHEQAPSRAITDAML